MIIHQDVNYIYTHKTYYVYASPRVPLVLEYQGSRLMAFDWGGGINSSKI